MITAKLIDVGIIVFGSKPKFYLWLISSVKSFGEGIPIEHSEERILEELNKIKHGIQI